VGGQDCPNCGCIKRGIKNGKNKKKGVFLFIVKGGRTIRGIKKDKQRVKKKTRVGLEGVFCILQNCVMNY
jgi:hypothetical protein